MKNEKEAVKKDLGEYTKIIVETDAPNPVPLAEITAEYIDIAPGYRVRFTPAYN